MHIQELYQLYLQYPSVQTDTRLLKPGDIFFALKGSSFNGNAFLVGKLAEQKHFLSIKINTRIAQQHIVNTQLVRAYNLSNVLCAVTVGKYFKAPEEQIIKAIEGHEPSNKSFAMGRKRYQ